MNTALRKLGRIFELFLLVIAFAEFRTAAFAQHRELEGYRTNLTHQPTPVPSKGNRPRRATLVATPTPVPRAILIATPTPARRALLDVSSARVPRATLVSTPTASPTPLSTPNFAGANSETNQQSNRTSDTLVRTEKEPGATGDRMSPVPSALRPKRPTSK
jgi:hypothetical protein